MGRHSGKFGASDQESLLKNWTIEHTSSPVARRLSNTRAGTLRTKGFQQWGGTYTLETGEPAVLPGETTSVTLYSAPDDNTHGGVGTTFAGTIMVDSVEITWDFSDGAVPLQSVVNFSGSGALTVTDADTAITDTGTTLPENICNMKMQTGPDLSETDLDNVTRIVFNLSADNKDSFNSSTSCWREKVAGPIDWTLAATIEENQEKLTLQNDYRIELFVDATNSWILQWGHFLSRTNYTVDDDSGDIISHVMNFGMTAHDGTSIGVITKPSGTDFWP